MTPRAKPLISPDACVRFPHSTDTPPEVAFGHQEGCCRVAWPFLLSFVVVLLSWPVRGPNRSLRWRRISGSLSCVCGIGWPKSDADERGSQTRLTGTKKEELAHLRRDKRRLELEVEILTDDKIDVAVACRVLAVSRSGYYDWLGRPHVSTGG
jgi:hypothetical protein